MGIETRKKNFLSFYFQQEENFLDFSLEKKTMSPDFQALSYKGLRLADRKLCQHTQNIYVLQCVSLCQLLVYLRIIQIWSTNTAVLRVGYRQYSRL